MLLAACHRQEIKPSAKPATQLAAKKSISASQTAIKPKTAPAKPESAQSSATLVQTASNR
jgi:hypothetical protein